MLGQQRLGPAESQKHLVFPLLPQKRAGYRAPTPHTGTVRAREVQRPRLSYREHASGAETTPPNADAMPLLQRPRVLRQRPCPLPRRPRLLVQRPHPQCRGHASLTETTSPAAEAIPPGAETTSPMQRPCLLLQRPCFLVQRRHLPAQRPRLPVVSPFSSAGAMPLLQRPRLLVQRPHLPGTPESGGSHLLPGVGWRIQSGLLSFSARTLVVEDACLLSAGG